MVKLLDSDEEADKKECPFLKEKKIKSSKEPTSKNSALRVRAVIFFMKSG